MLHHKANLNGYLSYQTGQSLEKINQDTDRDFFMSAKEAKEYGLIDGVITNPLKALQPLASAAEVNDRASVWTWERLLLHFEWTAVVLRKNDQSSHVDIRVKLCPKVEVKMNTGCFFPVQVFMIFCSVVIISHSYSEIGFFFIYIFFGFLTSLLD